MAPSKWIRVTGAAVLALSAAACGSDEAPASPPTAEELATSLITANDYEGDWSVNTGPDDSVDISSGVVPDDLQGMLPQFELCEEAGPDAKAAAEELRWMAFRQLDLTVDDPIEPPDDRAGHMVFAQEFLTSGEASDVAATYELLRGGFEACLGDIAEGEEGPGTAEVMTIPDVGDERYGVLTTFGESGGWAEWRLHNALVLQGTVLMALDIVDIRAGEGVDPYFTIDDVGAMIETAVDKL